VIREVSSVSSVKPSRELAVPPSVNKPVTEGNSVILYSLSYLEVQFSNMKLELSKYIVEIALHCNNGLIL